jgi:hypothetical protein
MKKRVVIVVLAITLCSLMLVSIGSASAAAAGFEHTSYMLVTPCTVDGKWTTTAEWSDCQQTMVGTFALYRDKWLGDFTADPMTITQYWLVEVLNDATTDTGDYVEICLDSNAAGGTAPGADNYRIVLTPTSMTWYKGTGTAWAALATPASAKYNTTINTSFSSGPAHRIYEVQYEKMALGVGATPNIRVAVYDASNAAAGVIAWPTGSSNSVPNAWGTCPYSMDAIPEGFNLGIILALASVAVISGAVLVRKHTVVSKYVTA